MKQIFAHRQGIQHAVVLIETDRDKWNEETARHINMSTRAGVYSIALSIFDTKDPFSPSNVRLFNDELSKQITSWNLDQTKIFYLIKGEGTGPALAALKDREFEQLIVVSPSVNDSHLNDDNLSFLNSHYIPRVISNNETKSIVFIAPRTSPYSSLIMDACSKSSRSRFFFYDWPLPISNSLFETWSMPLISTIVNNAMFRIDQSNIVSLGERNFLRYPAEPYEGKAKLNIRISANSRLLLSGDAQIHHKAAPNYGRQRTRVVLTSGNSIRGYAVGPVEDKSLSFRRWSVEPVDFSVTGFATFSGLGIDLDDLDFGSYELSLSVTNSNREVSIRPFTELEGESIELYTKDSVIRVSHDDGRTRIQKSRLEDVSTAQEVDLATSNGRESLEILTPWPSLANSRRLLENQHFYMVGPEVRTLTVSSIVTNTSSEATDSVIQPSYTMALDLNGHPISGSYTVVTRNSLLERSTHIVRKGVVVTYPGLSLSLLDTKANRAAKRSADRHMPDSIVGRASLVSLDEVTFNRANQNAHYVLIDLLDLAVDFYAEVSNQYEDFDPSMINRMKDNATISRISRLLSDNKTNLILHSVRVPKEYETQIGERVFYDNQIIRFLNTAVEAFENIFVHDTALMRVNVWNRGFRSVPPEKVDDQYNFEIEKLYYQNLEHSLMKFLKPRMVLTELEG